MSKFERDSEPERRKKSRLYFFLLLLVFLPRSQKALSLIEENPSPLIAKVLVWVNGQEDKGEIRQLVSIKEGDSYSLKNVTQVIRQLFKTGLFSDVQVAKNGEEKLELEFFLTRKLFTRKVIFSGDVGISGKKLREGIYSLRADSFFSEDKLQKAIQEFKEVLKGEGYFHPEIRASTEKDEKKSSIDVLFEINSGERFVLKQIAFKGEVLVPEAELKEKMESKEGNAYIPSLLDRDLTRLKEMYNLMGFQRAEVEVEERNINEQAKSVSLSLKVTPQEKIQIIIKGAKVPLSLVKPIWEERIFEEWGLIEGEAQILAYLRKKGYIFSTVNSSIERADSEIHVVHEVSAGQKYKIQGISFEGLKYFVPSELKRELGIVEKVPFLSWIDGERLFELPREIEIFYKSHGFSNTKVNLNFIKKDKKVDAIFSIEEGTQQKIKNISISGASLFSAETLLAQMTSFEGGPFFQPDVQKDREKLENFYLDQGVRGTEIEVKIENAGEDLFSLIFTVKEGGKIRIDKVIITGNIVTEKGTILKELKIREGEYAFQEKILETKRGLERLGIFSEVRMEEIPVSPEAENLVINLREGDRNYASLGVGLETKNEPRTFEVWDNVIRLRGTAEFIRSNIFGRASQLSFVAQASLKEKRGVVSWEQPYFFGIPIQTYLNAWLEREERKSFGYDRRGVSLTGIKSISESLIFLTTLRWARTTLYYLEISESEIDRQYFPFSATSLSGSIIWDRRDDTFNPAKGSFFSVVAEWAYPLFKAESDFLKTFIKYQHFFPVFSRLNFSSTARLGLGKGRMPIHERFFGGGSNSFRGEEFDELGPKDPNSLQPIGGKALFLLNFELRFPLVSAFKYLSGAIFYDKGNVFAKRSQFSLESLQDAVGIGIRYRTPLGPLRFDLGWNLDSPEGKRKPLAFITIGNVF